MNISEISPEAIISISTQMATNKVAASAGTLMLDKSLNTAETGAAALTDMMRSSMERSVNPAVGSHIDVSV